MPYLAVYQVVNVLNASTWGILRGTGLTVRAGHSLTSEDQLAEDAFSEQVTAARANIASFWLIGIPTALLLTFKLGWGLGGLWMSE